MSLLTPGIQRIAEQFNGNETWTIDLEDVSKGIYFICLNTGGSRVVEKVIIQ